MNISGVDLTLLEVFDALLTEGSVTAAAARLHLSQPALSHALKRLRAQIGDELFVRTRRGVQPTPRALDIAAAVRPALAQLRAAFERSAKRVRDEISGPVQLALDDYLQAFLLPLLARRVERTAPGISLAVPISSARAALALLREGKADILVDTPDLGGGRDIRQARLFEDRYVCLVRRGLVGPAGRISMELFSVLNHVGRTRPELEAQATGRALAGSNVARHTSVRLPGRLASPWVVATSDAVALVPERLATSLSSILPLDVLEPPIAVAPLVHVLYWHRRAENNRAVMWVVDQLREIVSGGDLGR